MCNLSKGVEEKGIEKGIEKGLLSSIMNLMETMNWTTEQAMDALKIPLDSRKQYIEDVKKH